MVTANTTTAILNRVQEAPPSSTLNSANYLNVPITTVNTGELDGDQIKALMAQAKVAADQDFSIISSKGIGAYGIPPLQLELAGYLKPGTVETYIRPGNDPATVLTSPAVWTGKDGVNNVDTLLTDSTRQTVILQDLFNLNYQSLLKLGIITESLTVADIGALLQASFKYGPNNVQAWLKGTATPDVTTGINIIARQGQYAINYVDNKLPNTVTGYRIDLEASGTVDRSTVDEAVQAFLSSEKLPVPNFTTANAAANIIATTTNTVTEARYKQVADQVLAARLAYNQVLTAANGNTTAPAVVAANQTLQTLLIELQRLQRQLGL